VVNLNIATKGLSFFLHGQRDLAAVCKARCFVQIIQRSCAVAPGLPANQPAIQPAIVPQAQAPGMLPLEPQSQSFGALPITDPSSMRTRPTRFYWLALIRLDWLLVKLKNKLMHKKRQLLKCKSPSSAMSPAVPSQAPAQSRMATSPGFAVSPAANSPGMGLCHAKE
jgi:hypothetical protein